MKKKKENHKGKKEEKKEGWDQPHEEGQKSKESESNLDNSEKEEEW